MAKRQKNTISVSWHEASKQWVKWVGRTKGADGKLRPKVFYLGSDETAAINKAVALREEWRTLRKSGADAWPDAAPPAETMGHNEPKVPATVEEAAKQFLASVEARRDAGQVSGFHYESMRCKVNRVVSFLGPKKSLISIGESELLVERSGIEPGSFKLLRKTGARMTKQLGGLEVSELYLAHQEPGQNKAYAGRRWELLDAALGEMRQQLTPMFTIKREQRRRRSKRVSQVR